MAYYQHSPLASARVGGQSYFPENGPFIDEELPFSAAPLPRYSATPDEYSHRVDAPRKGSVLHKGSVFIPGRRQSLNVVPVLTSLFVPWLLFCGIFWVMSFGFRYHHSFLAHLVAILALCMVLALVAYALRLRQKFNSARQPTWHMFLGATCLLAWFSGMVAGEFNFYMNAMPYYDIVNLNLYLTVDPARMHGEMLLDAGRVIFTETSVLDISRSMGFKSTETYCVAPIINRNATNQSSSVDFWAVGLNCCSGSQADFHCADSDNIQAHAGLRLMADDDRPFYRLAVQQAEARYGIKAAYPLFFTWIQDPIRYANNLYDNAEKFFLTGIFGYLGFQIFMVSAASLIFAKLGHL